MVSIAIIRIGFMAHRLPCPPDKGERIRAFYELKCAAPIPSSALYQRGC